MSLKVVNLEGHLAASPSPALLGVSKVKLSCGWFLLLCSCSLCDLLQSPTASYTLHVQCW
jgi:hypothetical protein